ncbi:Cyclic AMP receptor protein [Rhodocyclaceae bacterium]|nr:Cyclic AMP receptor protein [Rhodocyclaceae bacterium]
MGLTLFRPRKSTPRLEQLRALSLLVDLTPAELEIVDGLVHEREYLAGEIVFDEGEEGHAIYIVLDGEVLIRRQGDPDGACIAVLGPGTFFGELALLDDGPRSAQAVATKSSRLVVFFRDEFSNLLETHARIASKIARQLARHIGARMREMARAADAFQHL